MPISPALPRPVLLAVAAASTLAFGAVDASAATVSAGPDPDDARLTVARYSAAAGESNDVVVSRLGDYTVQISDAGATITPGEHCAAVDAHTARCSIPADHPDTAPFMQLAQLALGDGDDRALVATTSRPVTLHADAGPGDDQLTGGLLGDRLDGGGGRDRLQGGGGEDRFDDGDTSATADGDVIDGGEGRDAVSYAARSAPLVVDLADPGPDGQHGEGDTLSSIEEVTGGSGDDRLEGRGSPNSLHGGPGDDRLEGHGATDTLYGGPGRDVLLGQYGDDYLDGGSGDDVFYGGNRKDEIDLSGGGADRVDCGSGTDTVARPHADDLIHADCQVAAFRYTATPSLPWTARAYPAVTDGHRRLRFAIDCPRPATRHGGTLRLRELGGSKRVLASGRITQAAERRCRSHDLKWVSVEAPLTALGRRLAARSSGIKSTVGLRGSGLPPVHWSIVLRAG